MTNNDFKRFYLDVEGILRYYYLYIPPGITGKGAVPLVILLHGAGGNPRTVRNLTDMNELAAQEGFLVAYPQGTGPKDRNLTWNAGQCCGFAYENQVDDVAFIRELLAELTSQWEIDEKQVYVAGVSNGGMMAHRLACELSGQIAAAAAVAASLPKSTCSPAEPVAIIMFHGTSDKYVPYHGGASQKSVLKETVIHTSVQETAAFWVRHNGCKPQPGLSGEGNVKIETFPGGKKETEVIVYSIAGGGHTWPGFSLRETDTRDPMQQIKATPLIWQFFSRHKK